VQRQPQHGGGERAHEIHRADREEPGPNGIQNLIAR
jgi:hypothetical protein